MGHIKPSDLQRLVLRCPRLRNLVDPTQNPTRSGLEDTLVPWLQRHGLPIPQINVYLNGLEVDAYFPAHNLIVELDGWEFHSARDSFESDRERDARHLAHGTPTVRITPDRLNDREATRPATTLSIRR